MALSLISTRDSPGSSTPPFQRQLMTTCSGRTVTVRLRPQPLREAMAWLHRYERFWSGRLDGLAAYAESKEAEARGKGR